MGAFRPTDSIESLNRRERGLGSTRGTCRRGGSRCVGARGLRPRAAHAVPGGLPAVSRRTRAFQPPRPRDRRARRVADKGAGDSTHRAEHHSAGHRAQRGIARALRYRGAGREHQKQCGYAVDLDHPGVPTINDGMLTRLYGEMRDTLWLERGLLESTVPGAGAACRRQIASPRASAAALRMAEILAL